MMRIAVVCGLTVLPMLAGAMPSKTDLDKVAPVVAELMQPEQDALKSGKKTKTEVADAAIALVAQADGEAAKLLLLKGAFGLYVRDGQFDKAADTLKTIRSEVPDITPQYLVSVIEPPLGRVSRKKCPGLFQILDETKALTRYASETKKLETQAKANPADAALQTKLAEHYAVLGDWTKALDAFEKGDDAKTAGVAKDEKAGAADAKAIADFWWDYPEKKGKTVEKAFKQHAAKLYANAVASDKLVGLTKVQVERRIKEAEALGEAVTQDCDVFSKNGAKICVGAGVDMELIRCPAGEFVMGYDGWDKFKTSLNREARRPHKVKITKEFMLGKFPVTHAQWCAVMTPGIKPEKGMEDVPISMVSIAEMEAFCQRLTLKHKSLVGDKVFRLPTEAEWEYASKAGRNNDGIFGKDFHPKMSPAERGNLDALFRGYGYALEDHAENSQGMDNYVRWGLLPTGRFKPNEWGFYDMVGNAWEVMADRIRGGNPNQEYFMCWNGAERYNDYEVDPCRNEEFRLIRAGFCGKGGNGPSEKRSIKNDCKLETVGFRVCLGLRLR